MSTQKRQTFQSPFEQHADRNGQAFDIIGKITTPDDTHDAEVLPMYRIRFATDGVVIEAWPEEVEESVTPDYASTTLVAKASHAVLAGAALPAHDEVFDLAEHIAIAVGTLHAYVTKVRSEEQATHAVQELLDALR